MGIAASCGEREMLVDERNRGGAFADRAADALHRARAHVADGEYARHRRLERSGAPRVRRARLPRQHETVRIERDAAVLEPFGFRIGADEEKEMPDRPL